MSGADKARNKVDQVTGKVKAAIGRAINDPAREAQGRADQRAAHLRDAGEKVKDAFRPRRRRKMPRRRRQI
ncbi:MAG: CsbD family protein [Mycobacterium sp.]|uniref:CsbD family protein n=1 Tax=Mycobacterium sp. TaxID=1785 RepID=UPI002602B391|nr:CsbD family protein [Mycobacterium sp.]MCW2664209.1 CsbD family protein [Mycobacterium sp.]